MPTGQSSWIRRSMGLALSRQLLRRSLARQGAQGNAVLARVIIRPARGAGPRRACRLRLKQGELSEAERGMSNESMSFQQWAAKLSQPSVELRVQDDHVVLEEDGELIASGALSR